jgi:hypothetical protein
MQIGLDSGAITMLGNVVHSFGEPGEYRGTVRSGDQPEATFYISVDTSCAVAQLSIDLAELIRAGSAPEHADSPGNQGQRRFVVHPKGYAVFHVSGGSGGYSVNIRRADDNPNLKAYDTRTLQPGDIFSGVLLRPGTYSIRNLLSKAHAQATVAYPTIGKTAYYPPAPANLDVGETIEPRSVHLHPAQGVNLHVKTAARIKIELTRPDDGPGGRPASRRPGWKNTRLPQA